MQHRSRLRSWLARGQLAFGLQRTQPVVGGGAELGLRTELALALEDGREHGVQPQNVPPVVLAVRPELRADEGLGPLLNHGLLWIELCRIGKQEIRDIARSVQVAGIETEGERIAPKGSAAQLLGREGVTDDSQERREPSPARLIGPPGEDGICFVWPQRERKSVGSVFVGTSEIRQLARWGELGDRRQPSLLKFPRVRSHDG